MSTDRVSHFVSELCHMPRLGGKCVQTGKDDWEIRDIARWTEAQSTALRGRFPAIEASIVSDRQSLSGFAVRLHRQRMSQGWAHLLVTFAMVASLAAITRVVARMELVGV